MPVNVSNDAEISHGTPSAAWGTPTYYILDFGNDGGTTQVAIQFTNAPGATEVNREVIWAAGELDINFSSSTNGLTDVVMADILNEALDQMEIAVKLATGDPGANFNQNLISGDGYQDVVVAAGGFTARVT